MNIQEQLQSDMKDAMRSRDALRLDLIRMARAALQSAQLEAAKQKYDEQARAIEVQYPSDPEARDAALAAISADPHAPLDDAAQQAVLTKEIKRRYDSAELYRKGGRIDLAEKEEAELALLQAYLPQQMSAEELRPEVAAVIAELGLSGPAAMGKLMPVLVERFKGRADGRLLSQTARELLSGA
jgi:hypothetical protein